MSEAVLNEKIHNNSVQIKRLHASCKEIQSDQQEMLGMIHKDAIVIAEITYLQKANQADIKDLFHMQKNDRAAIKMQQEHCDKEFNKIHQRMIVDDTKRDTKETISKKMKSIVMFAFVLCSFVMSVYTWILEHFAK